MKIVALIIAVILFACRTCPTSTCPTLKAEGVAPLPVVTLAPRTPCTLPPRPQPYQLVGMASETGIVVTKSDLASLLVWLTGAQAWMTSAALCLEGGK